MQFRNSETVLVNCDGHASCSKKFLAERHPACLQNLFLETVVDTIYNVTILLSNLPYFYFKNKKISFSCTIDEIQ